MSNTVDSAVLALLNATAVEIYDGHVTDSDGVEKTISASLPYAVLYSALGYPDGYSLAGNAGVTVQDFQVNYVGETREQAKAAGAATRAVLKDVRLAITGTPIVRLSADNNLPVRRDDDWTRAGGGPLFFGVDKYSLTY